MTKTKIAGLLKWAALGSGLIIVGFICDGITEVGHHAALILGGVILGAGVTKEKGE